ncbi:hypothetical protein WID54_26320, partial [Enterobacter kobei]
SPNASNARVRSAAILARSQYIFRLVAVLPVVLSLKFRSITVQTDSAFYLRCGLRCRPAFSARSRAVVSARRNWRRIRIEENAMNIAYRLIHRHTRNTLIARGWPADLNIETSLNYVRGEGVAFTAASQQTILCVFFLRLLCVAS